MDTDNYPKGDNDYQDGTVTEVIERDEGHEIHMGIVAVGLKSEDCPTKPEVGDTVRMYLSRGSMVRGLFVNGRKCYYRTPEEEDARHAKWVENQNAEKKSQFEEVRADHDRRIDMLPEVFQRRIRRFQTAAEDWRWQFEGYELMCCEQAVLFANHFKTVEELQRWAALPYTEQRAEFSGIDEGHSGNSFSFSVRLAYWYIHNPENVVKEHGALTPLVGCRAYGCIHPEEGEGEAA